MAVSDLSPQRVDEILERLGLPRRVALDVEGLTQIFRAWCRNIPFDNLQKLIALEEQATELPGLDPSAFFQAWEENGTGGTCWSSNQALQGLLTAVGFDAKPFGASMFDGEVNHGTTLVSIDGTRWMVDTATHGEWPLPLVDGEPVGRSHQGYTTSLRPDPGGWLLICPTPDPDFSIPCRLHFEMDRETVAAAYEKSRGWSPFNDKVMAQRNDESGVWILNGDSLARIEASGITRRSLTGDEAEAFLVDTLGFSNAIVERVRAILSKAAPRSLDP